MLMCMECVVHGVCCACRCAWSVLCMECVVHGVCCVVGGCNVVATEHGRYSLSCMEKL